MTSDKYSVSVLSNALEAGAIVFVSMSLVV